MNTNQSFQLLSFYDLPLKGKNEWWRYGLSLIVLVGIWLGSSLFLSLILVGIAMLDNNPETKMDMETGQLVGLSPFITFLVLMMSFVFMLLAIWVIVRFIHQRRMLTLITPQPQFDWKRFAIGFGFFLILAAASSLVETILYPGRYQFTFKARDFFAFLPFILIFIPIQAGTEELLFRGYLLQSLGRITRRFFFPPLVTSLFFMLLHLANPEVDAGFWLSLGNYFLIGFLFAIVTIQDNRLELAMGAHIANNLYAAIFANYIGSALATPAIFTAQELDPAYNLIALIVISLIYYSGLFVLPKLIRK